MADLLERLGEIVGAGQVMTGPDMAGYAQDWTGAWVSAPLCVVRPATTAEIAAVVRLANEVGVPVVPLAGNTGLNGGAVAEGAILLSVERMSRIREIRPEARIAIVEAGVVLERLHEAAGQHGLAFPLTFGAKGSAMIGGVLSTNAGGSNVLRYGNTRDLCLGLEAVLPTGEVVDLMSELHKDNSGYDLRDLLIGAEGTLGIITAAVLKLVPRPRAYATAMVAVASLDAGLALLNRLQEATGGAVEACEYMPRAYMEALLAHDPALKPPFAESHDVNLLVEVGATAPRDADPGPDGTVPVQAYLEAILGDLFEEGAVLDAVVAQNDTQRAEMWARRERAAEVALAPGPVAVNDIAVPLDRVGPFLARADAAVAALDPAAVALPVAHLGDGNIHYAVRLSQGDAGLKEAVVEAVEEIVREMGGSFSAEHGIGLAKLPSMRRRKDAAALAAMRAIKAALDPAGVMNPGKVLPD
ncbi:FAD-binding oxidoreductase [Rhodosalinus halophilus]|uniref:FAD-binding oxidoreductase n=1 Tax=Rhodosalinus halophilus TaxID=2259333 RepID=A0A365UAJ2_9RHOB|nr:FAD-binding oxidoreductase [Rhodosalinus halophilus]RBI86205.1 FAD-binding oxidoreductase [Rhodosalinus halophilus]